MNLGTTVEPHACNLVARGAIEAVAEGRADGVVSAGNTGALMAIAKFVLKTMPGIDRPAIALSRRATDQRRKAFTNASA